MTALIGGCSSMAERRTVDANVAGSIPVNRPRPLHLGIFFIYKHTSLST